jgi:hypothetical protein
MIKAKKTTILSVVLSDWSLTLREEHRLRVFENRGLRRIFGPKRDEVTGGWGKLHNEELHNLPNNTEMIKSKRMRCACHVARMKGMTNAYKSLVLKPEGDRSLGRTTDGWEDNIKIDLWETESEGADWIHLAQDMD